MSSSDSGVIVVAAPVILTVGAVSMAAAGISAAAEHYKQFRLDQAIAEEMQRKADLERLSSLEKKNQAEYDAILDARIGDENARLSAEEQFAAAVRERQSTEMAAGERTKAEISRLIGQMDEAVERFEREFGADRKLEEMAETIRRSREMFGDGGALIEELNDLLGIIIPGMTEEKREAERIGRIGDGFKAVFAENFRIEDGSEEFISLKRDRPAEKRQTSETPWERFTARLRAAAETERLYSGTEAAEMLEEAAKIPEERRNFYIQQHEEALSELEDQAKEYADVSGNISAQVMDAFYMYTAMAKKLGITPAYTREDLSVSYEVDEMRRETRDMIELYKRQKERQYTAHAFSVVMERHHLSFENMASEADGREKMEFAVDGQAAVCVTQSASGAFEMRFEGRSKGAAASMDERRSITEKARHFCHILPEIVKELDEEFGITFEQTALQPPDAENIEIRQSTKRARTERTRTQKTMQMQ